ncbi:MAG TPA: hypothetical protein VKN99_09165, partial [Polyangia bacterium]|nr:hypothetical protein [Polyangia bacterium]
MKLVNLLGLVLGCAHTVQPLAAGDPRVALLHEAMSLHDGARYREAREKWLSLLESGQPALTIVAAEKIVALDGELGGDLALAARLRALAARLHPEARLAVLEQVARILRRGGDEAGARA